LIIGSYSFCGLLAGALKSLGKPGSCLGFVVGNAVLTFYLNGSTDVILYLKEILCAVVIFLLLPGKVVNMMTGVFTGNVANPMDKRGYSTRMKEITVDRLNRFSKAFKELSKTFSEISQTDVQRFIPLAILAAVIFLGALLRSVPGALLPLLVVFLSVLASFGLAGWVGLVQTAMSTAVPTILIAVGIADRVSPQQATAAADEVFAVFAEIEKDLNEWKPESALSKVNAGAGGPGVDAPAELCEVVALSLEVDEVVRMVALDRGGIVDEYLSVPEFYGPLAPGDVIGLAANPTVLARLTGAEPQRVREAAPTAASPADLPPAREILAALAAALGLEGALHGHAALNG
jgi:uncharacterized protein involved in cysteine biosynthesis